MNNSNTCKCKRPLEDGETICPRCNNEKFRKLTGAAEVAVAFAASVAAGAWKFREPIRNALVPIIAKVIFKK